MEIITHNEYAENIDKYPDICPHCHKHQIPKYISGLEYYYFGTKKIEAFFQCTNSDCNKGFIAYYYKGVLREISIGTFLEKEFSEIIKTISNFKDTSFDFSEFEKLHVGKFIFKVWAISLLGHNNAVRGGNEAIYPLEIALPKLKELEVQDEEYYGY